MELSFLHLVIMLSTIAIVISGGLYAARSVKSAEAYSLGGRAAGVTIVAGGIAGTAVGGGATVGTAQMAYTLGLSAWWFTLGSGISFILMGLFYARPLRRTALETIPQYLVLNYGKSAGSISSVVSSLGILFSAVASCLPGIQMISAILGIPSWGAACVLILLVASYVFFGGMRSAGVGGILKMAVIWTSLFIAGSSAFWSLHTSPALAATLAAFPWYSLFGQGVGTSLANLLALIVGILCTQTYIQAIFSASNPRTAAVGAFTAALIVIPVGLPCAAIGMFMHTVQPDILPILVLPTYLLQYQPVWVGGIAMGGIMLSLIGSIGGLSLGIGTMVSKDILAGFLKIKSSRSLLRLNRLVILGVMLLASCIAILNEGSQVLFWNYMSMALRGGGIFLPLTLAVFAPQRAARGWTVASMLLSTLTAILAAILRSPINPLFIGLTVSFLLLLPGTIIGQKKKLENKNEKLPEELAKENT
jgi:solute:Na+ symporter, SSS family